MTYSVGISCTGNNNLLYNGYRKAITMPVSFIYLRFSFNNIIISLGFKPYQVNGMNMRMAFVLISMSFIANSTLSAPYKDMIRY